MTIAIIANGLIILGVCLLARALLPMRQIIRKLPKGKVRRSWGALMSLLALFIAGYLFFAALHWNSASSPVDLIVPAIFFLGACFVLVVSSLSLQTALNFTRIASLENESITDPLTGLYNRRYLERRLKEEIERARRYKLPLSILLMDIDHFKQVNDTYGHNRGDAVLVEICKLIRKTVRVSDIVARFGGDEILVIASSTYAPDAIYLGERLVQCIACAPLLPGGENGSPQAFQLGVSIGVASFAAEMTDTLQFLTKADDALCCAKRGGRNKVCYEDPSLCGENHAQKT